MASATHTQPEDEAEIAAGPRGSELPGWVWALLPVLATLVAMRGIFDPSKIFFARDLTLTFWPHHLWFRNEVFAGHLPFWDPYEGLGRPGVADAARFVFFPPAVLLRLLLPAALGFDLLVALPVPLAALGAYLMLARRFSRQAASLGAAVFAVSGPVVATANMPNMSWCLALAPWALLATDRLAERTDARRLAPLAILFALQFLAGEPLTLACTAALCVLYAFALAPRAGTRAAAAVVASGAVAVLLVAPAAAVYFGAAAGSARAVSGATPEAAGLSLHPLWIAELLLPGVFGDVGLSASAVDPWVGALNHGMAPFLYSVFLGAGASALAAVAGAVSWRSGWTKFWVVVFLVALVCSLGYYTPVFALAHRFLPPLRALRNPMKFVSIAALAVAALAASGWETLFGEGTTAADRRRAAWIAGGGAAAAVLCWLAVAAGAAAAPLSSAARAAGLPDAAAASLAGSVADSLVRLAAVLAVTAGLVWLAGRGGFPAARPLLYLVVVADLLAVTAHLNPTLDAALLGEPDWAAAARARPESRVYVGGLMVSATPPGAPDPERVDLGQLASFPFVAKAAVVNSYFAVSPCAGRVPVAVCGDPHLLAPLQYSDMYVRFRSEPYEVRERVARRLGSRYFLLAGGLPLASSVPAFRSTYVDSLVLYELTDPPRRAFVAPEATVVASPADGVSALFAPDFDVAATALLEHDPPPPAGAPGPPETAAAEIARFEPNGVDVEARVPDGGGYLVLTDTFDAGWSAEVDGAPAPIVRADGLFRAVRLTSGRHTVRMSYLPRGLLAGTAVAALTLLGLAAACARSGRKREGAMPQGG